MPVLVQDHPHPGHQREAQAQHLEVIPHQARQQGGQMQISGIPN